MTISQTVKDRIETSVPTHLQPRAKRVASYFRTYTDLILDLDLYADREAADAMVTAGVLIKVGKISYKLVLS